MFNLLELFTQRRQSETWAGYSPERLQRLTLPLLDLTSAILTASGKLAISPGDPKTIDFLDRLIARMERLASTCKTADDLNSLSADLQKDYSVFGEWQQEEMAAFIRGIAETARKIVSTAEGALDDKSQTARGLRDIKQGLESVVSSDDIFVMRTTLNRQIQVAGEVLERYTESERQNRLEITRLVHDLHQKLESAETRSATDHLTSLANRGAFDYYAASMVQKIKHGEGPYTLAIIDVDDFKTVNDTFGHQAGDGALNYVAGNLTRSVGEKGFVARIGGDEFTVVYQGDDKELAKKLEGFLSCLNKRPFQLPNDRGFTAIKILCSIGIASFTKSHKVSEVIQIADEALYDAKRCGKNRMTLADAKKKAA